MTQTATTNNTTAFATTTTQQSPFRKIDPVQDLLSIEREKERSSRREKLLKIKEALLDGSHFKDGFIDSIGVDKKYSDRVKVEFAINDKDEFVARSQFENRGQFENIQLSEFNSGKLDFDSDKFGWSLLVETTMNLWCKTIFSEAQKWTEYEDRRKSEFLAELRGPNGILDSENHFRVQIIGDDVLRTNIVVTPIIDDDNRLLLCTSYKGLPVRGFISNPFNFLLSNDDGYGNTVSEKDIEEWFGYITQDIIEIEGTNQSQQATTVETTNQATDQSQHTDPIVALTPEAQKRKDGYNDIIKSFNSNKLEREIQSREFRNKYNLGRYGDRLSVISSFDYDRNIHKESIILDGSLFSEINLKLDFEREDSYLSPEQSRKFEKWCEETVKQLSA